MRDRVNMEVMAALAECIKVIDREQRAGQGDAEAMDEIYFLVTEAFDIGRGAA